MVSIAIGYGHTKSFICFKNEEIAEESERLIVVETVVVWNYFLPIAIVAIVFCKLVSKDEVFTK